MKLDYAVKVNGTIFPAFSEIPAALSKKIGVASRGVAAVVNHDEPVSEIETEVEPANAGDAE